MFSSDSFTIPGHAKNHMIAQNKLENFYKTPGNNQWKPEVKSFTEISRQWFIEMKACYNKELSKYLKIF